MLDFFELSTTPECDLCGHVRPLNSTILHEGSPDEVQVMSCRHCAPVRPTQAEVARALAAQPEFRPLQYTRLRVGYFTILIAMDLDGVAHVCDVVWRDGQEMVGEVVFYVSGDDIESARRIRALERACRDLLSSN